MATIYEIRRDNLRAYIRDNGGPTSVAKALGLSSASYLSQLTGRNKSRDLSEKRAREYERLLHLPDGWFDVERDAMGRPLGQKHTSEPAVSAPRPQAGRMAVCASAVFAAVHESKADLPPSKFEEMVRLVFEAADDKDEDELQEFARRLVHLFT